MDDSRAEINDGRDWENYEFDIASASDVTVNIAGTGTENAATKYLNKGNLGTGFVLRPGGNVSVVSIGTKTFRSPISISTAGMTVSKHLRDFNSIVIRTTVANTHIKLLIT